MVCKSNWTGPDERLNDPVATIRFVAMHNCEEVPSPECSNLEGFGTKY
jgi:hypothetical protein